MAIGDAYETAANYRAAVGKDDTADDTDILTDLTAISRYMERRLGRFFTKDASDATRHYYGSGGRTLYTDDIVSITSITIDTDRDGSFADETALAATDYELHPLNAADEPEAKPYTQIYLPAWSTVATWTPGTKVQVVGVFGWSAIPVAIKRACINLTAILRLETPRASRSVSETGEILGASSSANAIIEELFRHYGKVTL